MIGDRRLPKEPERNFFRRRRKRTRREREKGIGKHFDILTKSRPAPLVERQRRRSILARPRFQSGARTAILKRLEREGDRMRRLSPLNGFPARARPPRHLVCGVTTSDLPPSLSPSTSSSFSEVMSLSPAAKKIWMGATAIAMGKREGGKSR